MTAAVTFLDSNGHARPWDQGDHFLQLIETVAKRYDGHPRAMEMYQREEDSQKWRKHVDGLDAGTKAKLKRRDSFNSNAGVFLPRQLEYVHRRVIEEKTPQMNAFTKFRQAQNIPPGARTHTVRRYLEQGEASWYRGQGQDIPKFSGKQKEEQYPVRHVVSSVRSNHFEDLAASFANLNKYERDLRGARKTIERFLNIKLWNGDEDVGFLGILNYPYLAKFVSSTNFYEDGATTPDDIIAALNQGANYADDASLGVFSPNRCVTSQRVRNFLMNKPRLSGSDMSVGKWFVENNEFINAIESAWELKGISGANVDGILFYNDDADSISNEMAQGLTILPQQLFGFDRITYIYMSSGGMVMRDSGNNVLMYVTAKG